MNPFLLALLAIPAFAQDSPSCTPLSHAPYTLPYEISDYSGYSPSGRPGSNPTAHFNITFHDPNTCVTGSCEISWNISQSRGVWEGFTPCNETDIEEQEGVLEVWREAWQNLKVRWRFAGRDEGGEEREFTMIGNGTFLYRTVCGGSGVCSSWSEETSFLGDIWEEGEGEGDGF
jgi:hypothetical protein